MGRPKKKRSPSFSLGGAFGLSPLISYHLRFRPPETQGRRAFQDFFDMGSGPVLIFFMPTFFSWGDRVKRKKYFGDPPKRIFFFGCGPRKDPPLCVHPKKYSRRFGPRGGHRIGAARQKTWDKQAENRKKGPKRPTYLDAYHPASTLKSSEAAGGKVTNPIASK